MTTTVDPNQMHSFASNPNLSVCSDLSVRISRANTVWILLLYAQFKGNTYTFREGNCQNSFTYFLKRI